MLEVYLKELKELLRDRKTLFFMIALPVIIFPVIFGLMALVVANVAMDEQKKVLRYSIINSEQAPKFAEELFYHRDFKRLDITLATVSEIEQAIKRNRVDVVIHINEEHQTNLSSHQQDHWKIYFNNASQLNFVKQKVNKVFKDYVSHIQQGEIERLGLSNEQFLFVKSPVTLNVVNTANERENIGEKIGGFLPYLLIILCLTGAMYPAIDIGAGEKERGTLETLLLTPISRVSIVLGKFLIIMTTGIVTAFITLMSLVFWTFIIGEIANVEVVRRVLSSVGAGDLLLILLMLIPVSSIFAALLLAISIYARSFKEAQNYMGPMSILGFFPVMVAMLPGVKLNWTWSIVPISNVALAIKEIIKGTIDYTMLVAILSSSVVFAILSIYFCVSWFNKESVLFR